MNSHPVVQAADREERFVLLGGFNDIFVVTGLVVLTIGLVALSMSFPSSALVLPWIFAAIFWGLSEVFTTRMRLALPSIVLLVLFCGSVFIGGMYATSASDTHFLDMGMRYGMKSGFFYYMPIVALVTALAACGHYWRFGVPIGLSLICGAFLMAIVVALFNWFPVTMLTYILPLQGLLGLIPFGAALWLDAKDPQRETRQSDAAFWLHMLAAPLLCKATMAPFVNSQMTVGTGAAGMVLVVFLLWLLMALLINRRVFVVSGMSYAGLALGSILYHFGVEKAGLVAACGIVIGATVLLLAVWWNQMRVLILRGLRVKGLKLPENVSKDEPVQPKATAKKKPKK